LPKLVTVSKYYAELKALKPLGYIKRVFRVQNAITYLCI